MLFTNNFEKIVGDYPSEKKRKKKSVPKNSTASQTITIWVKKWCFIALKFFLINDGGSETVTKATDTSLPQIKYSPFNIVGGLNYCQCDNFTKNSRKRPNPYFLNLWNLLNLFENE